MKKIKLLALISAVLTALLLYLFLSSLSKPTEAERAQVLVAAADIPANTSITEAMITTADLPTEAVLSNALSDPSAVIGRVAQSGIYAGEQLLASKLVTAGGRDSKTLAYAIEPGMRAITIPVDQISGVSYLITPGDHVDILAQLLVEEDTGSTEKEKVSYAVMVLENIHVLAVDSVLTDGGKLNSESPQYTALTLEVTPKQAMKLSMAEFEGELRAVLRSPVDQKATNQPNLTLDDVLGGGNET